MSEAWILLETSGRGGQVGLMLDGDIHSITLDATRRNNRDLAPAVNQLLMKLQISPRELTGFMVSIGPGSYTGLRVGIMSAKAAAYALSCRLVAVPTFRIYAHSIQPKPASAGRLHIVADALQSHIYCQSYQKDESSSWVEQDELQILPLEEWSNLLKPGDAVAGPGTAVVETVLGSEHEFDMIVDAQPRLDAMWQVGASLPTLTRDELLSLEPLYLRGSSAEEKAKRLAALQKMQQNQ